MPRSLFEPIATSSRRTRRPVGTVLVSVALHAAALATVAGLHLTAAGDPPEVNRRLVAYVEAPPSRLVAPPVPPVPRPAVETVAAVPITAPTVAPRVMAPEGPAVTALSAAPIPSGAVTIGPANSAPLAAAGAPVSLGDPPKPAGPVRIGGAIRPPTRVMYVPAVYPLFARSARIEGDVVLEATIDEKGRVVNATVQRSVPALDRAAIDAVSRWRYTPTELNGLPVAIVMVVTVQFRLR